MTFELRIIDSQRYDDVAASLRSIERGDTSGLERLSERARDVLVSDSFVSRNAHSPELVDTFRDGLKLSPSQPITDDRWYEFVDAIVALLCMPEFQFIDLSPAGSPFLVTLGDGDGGLYGLIGDTHPFFDEWFGDLLARESPYAYGESMSLLSLEEAQRLRVLVEAVEAPNEYAASSRMRLVDMTLRAEANDWSVAISIG